MSSSSAYSGSTDTVLVAAAGRSGQTWLCFLLSHLLNARFIEPYCVMRGIVFTGHSYVLGLTQGALPGRDSTRYALVLKTHEKPDPYYSLTKKLILIVRDPRDMIASSCMRFQVMKETGADIEEDAQAMTLDKEPNPRRKALKDRIWSLAYGQRKIAIYLTARKWRDFHAAWRRLPFCYTVRYEDLLQDSVKTMSGIVQYLELPIDEAQIKDTLNRLSFQEITGRTPGKEAAKSIMFRKAVVGDHKQKLTRLEIVLVRAICGTEAATYGYVL